jgi:hypothetical protein
MKKIYPLLIMLFVINIANAQSCLHDGITFTTQIQIDNFQTDYPDCTQIEGNVTFNGSLITNLDGLSTVTSFGKTVSIYLNSLKSLEGLSNLTTIGEGLYLSYDDSLINLAGLENLTSIGGMVVIEYNKSLTSLKGIDNVTSLPGLFSIKENDHLCDCSVQSICTYLAGSGTAWIEYNAPGCNSVGEVEMGCGVGMQEHSENQTNIYPNTSSTRLTFETSAFSNTTDLIILNINGQELLKHQITGRKTQLDISNLSAGVYIVKLRNEDAVQIRKFIKE